MHPTQGSIPGASKREGRGGENKISVESTKAFQTDAHQDLTRLQISLILRGRHFSVFNLRLWLTSIKTQALKQMAPHESQ